MKPTNSASALDLYAKVEDVLGVKEAAPGLYKHYFEALANIPFDSLLDVGCGSGDFLAALSRALPGVRTCGIDLSPQMVAAAREQGIDADCVDLCDVAESFDVITATFDVLNYLDSTPLERFLGCVQTHLRPGGHFLCDINTLYGFTEIAVGSFIADADERFVAIDSDFDGSVYHAEFTLFEQEGEQFVKSQETIRQYYHGTKEIEKLSGLTLITKEPVALYGDEADKLFLVITNATNSV